MAGHRRRGAASAALALGTVALAAVAWSGTVRRPAGAAEGGSILPIATPSGTAPTRVRLASFNIHGGKGTDQRVDLRRIADVVKGLDLVALQEVKGGYAWGTDQADAIGSMLHTRALFAPTEVRWWEPSFGNGLLTNTPIDSWRRCPLPEGEGRAPRNVVRLEVPFGKNTLHVLMTHLSLMRSHHGREFETVADLFLKAEPPAVLMGDLNMHPNHPALRRLLETDGVEDPVGRRVPDMPGRWEYILLRGVRWRDAGSVDTGASDHAMIWVEIESE